MSELEEKTLAYNRGIKTALETILAELNKGQQKKLAQNPIMAEILVRYGVEVNA